MKLAPLLILFPALAQATISTSTSTPSFSFTPSTSHSASPSPWPTHTFHTTHATVPILNITKSGPTALGLIFIAPSTGTSGSPAIYTDEGDLVWHGPIGKTYAYQPQFLNGEPVLTFWQGHFVKGFGYGHIVILDSGYREIHRVTLPGTETKSARGQNFVTATNESFPSYIDIHESTITENGTILVTAVNVTQADLTPVGGRKDGWVQDALVYELDIATNEVLFRWSAVEHMAQLSLDYVEFPLGEMGVNKTAPYEYPHLNSVAKYGEHYLVSSRYMCAVFLIDRKGDMLWLFHGQNGGTFTLPNNTTSRFCYQHDARIHVHTNPGQPNETITLSLHNNANENSSKEPRLTTDLVFNLFPANKTTALVSRTYDRQDPITAVSQGNYQSLSPNGTGHYLAGHGAVPKIEEYDQYGRLVMRGWFGAVKSDNGVFGTYDWTSYRAFRAEWHGRPEGRPDVFACKDRAGDGGYKLDVYVSWNGATDVEGWRAWGGSSQNLGTDFKAEGEGDMRILKHRIGKAGFETRSIISLGSENRVDVVAVEAIGGVGDGARSKVVAVASCAASKEHPDL
ncbi:arylsulfotransferase family protein [Aspergillus undulatus]|uniref:arylsulfotransferase family protein n=1 Tax=Aspergillus undulatus TaxID=1810928 RepID=UPI003CCE2608